MATTDPIPGTLSKSVLKRLAVQRRPKKSPYTLEMYQSRKTYDWHWRLRHRNGRVLADSGEGYVRKATCLRLARSLFPSVLIEDTPGAKR